MQILERNFSYWTERNNIVFEDKKREICKFPEFVNHSYFLILFQATLK